ncbi:hypothetical protein M422DRAFT_248031 [Sphaerobolus stellatus SS14]|nr:hypothetical protein M422DRAFT_248031 [Sphaerobolus stellatus SS14]
MLSPLEARLKEHFFMQYAPWLPTISLFATFTTIPAMISPSSALLSTRPPPLHF